MHKSAHVVFALLLFSPLSIDRCLGAQTRLDVSDRRLSDDAPYALVGAAAVRDTRRNRLLVFGSNSERIRQGKTDGVLLALDMASDRWTTIEMAGDLPTGLTHPGLTYVKSADALFVFGGWAPGAQMPSSELWKLDLSGEAPYRWKNLPREGDWPPARNGMIFVCDDKRDRLLLHSGNGGPHPKFGFTPLDDLWTYDLKKAIWTRIDSKGEAPRPRWNLAGALDADGDKLYEFGGSGYVLAPTFTPVADARIHVLDLATLTWSTMPRQAHSPRPVEGTSLTFDPEARALVVVGGLSLIRDGKPASQRVYCFDLDRKLWTRSETVLSKKRRDHVAIYDPVRHRHLIFGGESIIEGGNDYRPGRPFEDAISVVVKRVHSAD